MVESTDLPRRGDPRLPSQDETHNVSSCDEWLRRYTPGNRIARKVKTKDEAIPRYPISGRVQSL